MRTTLVAITLVTLAACSSSGGGGGSSTVATPTFTPAAGTYNAARSVTIACATAGAAIHYTIDGSTPTASSTTYATAISITATTTVKAMGTASNMADSAVATATYTIDVNATPAAAPTFSPAGGSYSTAQSVTLLTATTGASIYYTTDGSTPTTASTLYSAPVQVAASVTLKAIAAGAGHTASPVATAAYIIGGSGSDYVTVCNSFISKQLSLYETCLHTNPDFISSYLNSPNFCANAQKEIAAGLISYNATQGAACASAVQALTCADLDSLTDSAPAACNAALTGTVATGGSCYSGTDCANGFCTSDHSGGACPGTCQTFAGLGADCTDKDCAVGQTCEYSGMTPTCMTESAVGGPCPCKSGLWCDSSGTSPVCKAKLAVGVSCSTGDGSCVSSAKCTGTSPTCQSYLGAGATCTAGTSPLDSLCGAGYLCDGSSKCVAYPKLGQACSATVPVCISAYCDLAASSPTCRALLADGASCTFGYQCASLSCNTSTMECDASTVSTCVHP